MKVLIVIVLFQETLDNCLSYQSLKESCSLYKSGAEFGFFIYDNSPYLQPVSKDRVIVRYVSDIENGGVSKAYNEAAIFAKENGYNWLLIADQDTFFPSSIYEKYYDALLQNTTINLILPKVRVAKEGKYMSPVRKNHFFSRLSDSVPTGQINPAHYSIINSGILVKVDAFLNVGGYNENVWLDFADFQFIERFTKKYDKAFVVNVECIQSFSDEIPDIHQKIYRFKLFCSSVKYFEPRKLIDHIWIFGVVVKRCLSLVLQSHSLKPFSIIRKYYLQ